MGSPEILFLDVGHGNCSLLRDGGVVTIVDGPRGPILLETLEKLGVTVIEYVVVSHADLDHVGGVTSLLTSGCVEIRHLFVNPDSAKRSDIWASFRSAVAVARTTTDIIVHTSLTPDDPGTIVIGRLSLSIVAPSPQVILGGAGSTDLSKRTLRSNSVSAVLRLVYEGVGIALLTGDIDDIGLDNMLAEGSILQAKILVFPHHGGLPGTANPAQFCNVLCSRVMPELVVFSNGRGRFDHPAPEIIEGVRAATSAAIACTQLSMRCAATSDGLSFGHLLDLPAHGKQTSSCCAGSLHFQVVDIVDSVKSAMGAHQDFVVRQVTSPLCHTKRAIDSISIGDSRRRQ